MLLTALRGNVSLCVCVDSVLAGETGLRIASVSMYEN